MKRLILIPARLLNSVPFGIALMALTALYIALGSARPWFANSGFDSLPGVRDWFDKTDLQFFNAWPLKLLMGLLVANLVVVTWRRIPLVPSRYGVWGVHAGIISLVIGAACYYRFKVEGHVRIYADPAQGPNVVSTYYDAFERSLYFRTGRQVAAEIPLPELPRYQEYKPGAGGEGALKRRDLFDVPADLTHKTVDREGREVVERENLAALMGLKGRMSFDVVGFYPYALIRPDVTTDPASAATGVELLVKANGETRDWSVVGSDPQLRTNDDTGVDFQHVEGDATAAGLMVDAVGKLFHIDVTVAGKTATPASMDVGVGKSYPVAGTGYTLKVEGYNPSWLMFGTGEPVKTLTLLVASPTRTFRRMVIVGRPLQTDFVLDDPKAGPMGGRQKKPVDDALQIGFTVHDTYHLLPDARGEMFADAGSVRHTLLTPGDTKELIDVAVGNGRAATVARYADGGGDIELNPHGETAGPMAATTGGSVAVPAGGGPATEPADGGDAPPPVQIHLQRLDHVKVTDRVVEVPARLRDRNDEAQGNRQVALVRVRLGDWSQTVPVPFVDEPADRLRQDPWARGFVSPPGAIAPLQLQLGNTRRDLPTKLSLSNFQLVPYPGMSVDDPRAMMRDFRSTVVVGESGSDVVPYTDVAAMNHPIYYNGGQWLFFQAAYDSGPTHAWTQLGVGNRPFVGVMIAGCVLIFAGLMYAFYLKPILIRRAKSRALAAAVADGRVAAKKPRAAGELVAS